MRTARTIEEKIVDAILDECIKDYVGELGFCVEVEHEGNLIQVEGTCYRSYGYDMDVDCGWCNSADIIIEEVDAYDNDSNEQAKVELDLEEIKESVTQYLVN